MKKIICLILMATLTLGALSGCAEKSAETAEPAAKTEAPKTEEKAEEKTEETAVNKELFKGKTMELWIGAAAGAAQDLYCRYLAAALEKYWDCTFVIQNKPGGGAFVCYNEFVNRKPDGLTAVSITSSMQASRLNPSALQKVSVDDFTLVGGLMNDPSTFIIRADETRFTNLDEFIEYAKENEVVATINQTGCDDDLPTYYFNEKYGTKISVVANSNGSAGNLADLLGGHVDIISNNVAPFISALNEGQVKMLAAFDSEKVALAPDVPTLKELKNDDFRIGNARGIALPAGASDEVVATWIDGLKWAVSQESLQKEFEGIGFPLKYYEPEEFIDQSLVGKTIAGRGIPLCLE